MTVHHPGRPTRPLRVGAPLPDEWSHLPTPTLEDVSAEIQRGEVELMYAIARHRKAWRVMRQRAERRAELVDHVGMLSTLESDPHWKKATGDVSWWRDEMTAQATSLSALRDIRTQLLADQRKRSQQ